MKIALEWLRSLVPATADDATLAEVLTMGGLEVEEAAATAPAFEGVVAAFVLETAPHPQADRLRVCRVDTGEAEPRTIVCGAPNVAPGMLVPCALPGALLPGGLRIAQAKVRGVASAGMLCSARELGLAEDAAGLMTLPGSASPGADVRIVLGLDETVFDVNTTPNRGDCLSALGLARELSALTGVPLRAPQRRPCAVGGSERRAVRIEDPRLCGRFAGRIVRGLDAAAPIPDWMRRRLEQSGQRPVSALVDISNYVMLELGQPSHVFDLSRLEGDLVVRWARAGERLRLLNDQELELEADVGLVCDARGPQAMAGIMGGHRSAVDLATRDVFIEAAFWVPEAIQGKARRYNFGSEASHRFERGVDFALGPVAIERLTELMLEICGGPDTVVHPLVDAVAALPARHPVEMRLARTRRVLGFDLGGEEVGACFDRLGFSWSRAGDTFRVEPPSYRFDIEREVDLIEEVARVHGYDHIPAEPPRAAARMRARREGVRPLHEARREMARLGYQELVNFSFVPEAWERDFGADLTRSVRVLNPIASQYSVMRSTLVGGLLANLRHNLQRQACSSVRTFELGRVFQRDAQQSDGPRCVAGIAQPHRLAGLAWGHAAPEQWAEPARAIDFFDLKGDLERLAAPLALQVKASSGTGDSGLLGALHPGRRGEVWLGERCLGVLGELHPRLCKEFELPSAPIVFEVEIEALLNSGLPHVRDIPRFPALVRDIAVWVDAAVPAGAVLDDLRRIAHELPQLGIVRSIEVFDVFRPPPQNRETASAESPSGLLNKEKSLAFRMVLQDTERTLAESDADAARLALISQLQQHWGARLRQ